MHSLIPFKLPRSQVAPGNGNCLQSLYVFSANGAPSSLAWGNAPGNRIHNNKALKARPQRDRRGLHTRVESRFQRSSHFYRNPGALPQATIEWRAFGAKHIRSPVTSRSQVCRLEFRICGALGDRALPIRRCSRVRYCTVTSVPTGISEKNFRAVSSGNRMQPCDAG